MSVVISKYDLVSPLGYGLEANWQNLFDRSYSPKYKLERDEFGVLDYLFASLVPEKELLRNQRVAVVVSNSKYNFSQMKAEGSVTEQFFQASLSTYLASKIGGDCIPYAVSCACATGLLSVIKGVELINRGVVDIVIAGSIETSKVPLVEAAFKSMGVLSHCANTKPFAVDRDGFVIGEGGALFLLIKDDLAQESNLPTVKGYSYINDAWNIATLNPNTASIELSMHKCLEMAGFEGVDFINAHGTATRLNDEIELKAMHNYFGGKAKKPYISSTKQFTGHLLGATGSVELALSLESRKRNRCLPIFERERLEPLLLPFLESRTEPLQSFMTLNYGFGGHIVALVVA